MNSEVERRSAESERILAEARKIDEERKKLEAERREIEQRIALPWYRDVLKSLAPLIVGTAGVVAAISYYVWEIYPKAREEIAASEEKAKKAEERARVAEERVLKVQSAELGEMTISFDKLKKQFDTLKVERADVERSLEISKGDLKALEAKLIAAKTHTEELETKNLALDSLMKLDVSISNINGQISAHVNTKKLAAAVPHLRALKVTDLSIWLDKSDLNLDSVKNLPNLTKLSLNGEDIDDLDVLRFLKHLKQLNVGKFGVINLDPVKQLTSLEVLRFDGNLIKDLDFLRPLSALKILSFNENRYAKSIDVISKLAKLEELHIRGTSITSLIPIKGLKSLKHLDASQTGVTDLNPLKDLTNLTFLELNELHHITDPSPLGRLQGLEMLFMDSAPLVDLSPIRNLRKLQQLNLDRVLSTSVEPLKDLHELRKLSLVFANRLATLKPLGDLTGLQSLYPPTSYLEGKVGTDELTWLEAKLPHLRIAGSLSMYR